MPGLLSFASWVDTKPAPPRLRNPQGANAPQLRARATPRPCNRPSPRLRKADATRRPRSASRSASAGRQRERVAGAAVAGALVEVVGRPVAGGGVVVEDVVVRVGVDVDPVDAVVVRPVAREQGISSELWTKIPLGIPSPSIVLSVEVVVADADVDVASDESSTIAPAVVAARGVVRESAECAVAGRRDAADVVAGVAVAAGVVVGDPDRALAVDVDPVERLPAGVDELAGR